MTESWQWAVEAYGGSPMKAEEIAFRVRLPVSTVYARMHKAHIRKYHRTHAERPTTQRAYHPDLVEQARLLDCSRRDAALLMSHPRFRCGTCLNLSEAATCAHCGTTINEYLRRTGT